MNDLSGFLKKNSEQKGFSQNYKPVIRLLAEKKSSLVCPRQWSENQKWRVYRRKSWSQLPRILILPKKSWTWKSKLDSDTFAESQEEPTLPNFPLKYCWCLSQIDSQAKSSDAWRKFEKRNLVKLIPGQTVLMPDKSSKKGNFVKLIAGQKVLILDPKLFIIKIFFSSRR